MYSGQIRTLYVNVDDVVHEGQVVADISQPEIERELADAESSLQLLRKEREMTLKYGGKAETLRTKNVEEQRQTLQAMLDAQEKRARTLKEVAEHYGKLIKKGVITYTEYIDAQNEYALAIQSYNDTKVKLTELSVTTADEDTEHQKENIDLNRRIMEAEAKLTNLKSKLSESTQIISPYSGRVTEIIKDEIMLISPGDALLTLEQSGKPDDLKVVAYFAPYEGKQISEGMTMGVTPSVVRREEYGFILAKVSYVSSFPSSSQGMLQTLRNADLVETLSSGGAPIMVKAWMEHTLDTPSGFRWSSGQGPDMSIHSGTMCDVSVVVSEQPPITLVIPFLKRIFLGIGDERLDREEE